MTGKKKIFIILAVVLFLLLLLWLIWFFLNQNKPSTVVNTIPATNPQTLTPRDDGGEPAVLPVEEIIVVDSELQSLAYTFAERYGSFSSQTDYANLHDVLPLMTGNLRIQTENYLQSAKTSTEYYGVTTRILSVKVVSSDDALGVVEVSTQREESVGDPSNSRVKYQKLVLNYIKEAGVWKVTSALWQ